MEKKVITEQIFNEHRRYSSFNDTWTWGEVQERLKKRLTTQLLGWLKQIITNTQPTSSRDGLVLGL